MAYFLVNEVLPQDIRVALSRYGECISLPPFEKLPFPVRNHPDMLMAQIEGEIFVHHEYMAGQRILDDLGVKYHLSEMLVGEKYPADVVLNCFSAGGCLFGKLSVISEEVKKYAEAQGLALKNVSQGYAKCSCAVANNAVVTSDCGIYQAAKVQGLHVLLIPPAHIDIEVYDTGFIGGASVALDEKTIGFFGDIDRFPSGKDIRTFFERVGVTIVNLSTAPLFDYGGAIKIS